MFCKEVDLSYDFQEKIIIALLKIFLAQKINMKSSVLK